MMGRVAIRQYYAELARLIEQVGLPQTIRVNDQSREVLEHRIDQAKKKGKEVAIRV
jgi:hypothetical protein